MGVRMCATCACTCRCAHASCVCVCVCVCARARPVCCPRWQVHCATHAGRYMLAGMCRQVRAGRCLSGRGCLPAHSCIALSFHQGHCLPALACS